jgi:hypothetical protein
MWDIHKIGFYHIFEPQTSQVRPEEEIVKCYIWSIVLYGAETWTPRAVD